MSDNATAATKPAATVADKPKQENPIDSRHVLTSHNA